MIAFKQGGRSVAQLLVRKIPDDVMDGIRKAALAEGLSVEEFALARVRGLVTQFHRRTEEGPASRNRHYQDDP